MINRRKWIRRALIVGAVGLGSEQLWRHGHSYVLPNRFLIVEPGMQTAHAVDESILRAERTPAP